MVVVAVLPAELRAVVLGVVEPLLAVVLGDVVRTLTVVLDPVPVLSVVELAEPELLPATVVTLAPPVAAVVEVDWRAMAE